MAAKTLSCPNCGAPLDFQGDAPTIRCPYCHTSVVVPEELRDDVPQPVIQIPVVQAGYAQAEPRSQSSGGKWILAALLVVIVLIAVVSVVAPLLAVAGVSSVIAPVIGQIDAVQVEMTQAVASAMASPTPRPSATPLPSPTPAFANPALTFGKEGSGPGQLTDARSIAVDGEGIVYVAEYQGGRIQAFDSAGKYLTQWKVGDSDTIIHGLAASYQGDLFVAAGRDIVRFAGVSGREMGRMRNAMGGDFGDLEATAEGGAAALWYEGRWGMITSLEGHRENVIFFDRSGEQVNTIESPVSGQTESPALDVAVALDGDGNLFLMEGDTIYRFSPEGKYVDRFNSPDRAASIAVDGQGRVYMGGSREIFIFSNRGELIASFPVERRPDSIAIDAQGGIWTVARQSVTKYVLRSE